MSAPPLARHVRHVETDAPAHLLEGTRWRGVLVLGPDSPALDLWARAEGHPDIRVTWGLSSPKMGARFPRAANGSSARFEVVVPDVAGRIELVLRRPGGTGPGAVVATAGPDGPPEPGQARAERDLAAGVEAAVRRGTLSDAEFAALDAGLGLTPLARRDAAWLRRSVLVLVLARERPRVVLGLLGELRARVGEGEFEEFWGVVGGLLGSLAVTPSGYHEALGALGDARFLTELRDLVDRLEGLGLAVFVNSGTLLGLVREGRPLGHDYDADLGVLLPVDDVEEVVPRFWEVKQVLRDAGLLLEDYETHHHHARMLLASRVPVDLFPAWAHDGRLHVWPWADGELPVTALAPLRVLQVQGVPLPVPADADAVLEVNYGPGWRSFDPAFTFDWAHARERHASYVEASRARWEREHGRV